MTTMQSANEVRIINLTETIKSIATSYLNQQELGENEGWEDKEFELKMRSMGWKSGWSWCMLFVRLVIKESMELQVNYMDIANDIVRLMGPSCMTTLKNFKDKGIVVSKKPEVGAIVIWSKGNWKGHTGIVSDITALEAQGVFFTIEGNTSYASDSNGDKVMVRKRYLKDSPSFKIAGFINPKDIIDYVTTNNKSTV